MALAIGGAAVVTALIYKHHRETTLASGRGLDALEAKQREHEQRLAMLQREIADAEQRAELARRAAALEKCHSDAERIDAAVSAKTAACMREVAVSESCKASNERNKGESMRNGCALGLVAAALTGGGSLLLTGGGCLAGELHGESERVACPEATCTTNAANWMPEAAREASRHGIPICELGFEVIDMHSNLDGGLLVLNARAGASSAGLTKGDVIVRVGGMRVRKVGDIRLGARTAVDVEYVRDGLLRSVRVRVTEADGRKILGVEHTTVDSVRFIETKVVRVDDGPASVAGLERGDRILGIGKSGPLRAIELYRAARRSTGEVIHVLRKGKRLKLAVQSVAPRQ